MHVNYSLSHDASQVFLVLTLNKHVITVNLELYVYIIFYLYIFTYLVLGGNVRNRFIFHFQQYI